MITEKHLSEKSLSEVHGIKIGTPIKVLQSFLFDGSLKVKIARRPDCIISGLAAQNIFVYDN
jgi:hypothetical protein